MHRNLENKIKNVPISPGCYIWKDNGGGILYVGKAVNLHNRVHSYVNNYDKLDPKIKVMIDQASDVEYLVVDTEVEALILESNLIKKYKPKYNKLMKDDKSYSWVKIDWYNSFPSVKIVREMKDSKSEYYGPYPSIFPVRKVLEGLRKSFPYCDHLPRNINSRVTESLFVNKKPCFDFHIGLCSGVCSGVVDKQEHRNNILGIRKFLQGKKIKIIDTMKEEMFKYSKDQNFEEALKLRDRISNLEYVTQHIKVGKDIDEEKLIKMKKESTSKSLENLIDKLDVPGLVYKESIKIECYDISNIQGTNAVGSMIVFMNGKPEKSLYRKFKIKTKTTPDDFLMMKEVLSRRLKYIDDSSVGRKVDKSLGEKPDLIIVDGGKGQLSSVFDVLQSYDLASSIPVVGLAKREEEIFKIELEDEELGLDGHAIAGGRRFKKIILKNRSEELYLIQRIRDEAHRFAIGYHRRLRSDKFMRSVLDDIPGLGGITKKRLFLAFGSVDKMRKAKKEDLDGIIRNSKTLNSIMKVLKIH